MKLKIPIFMGMMFSSQVFSGTIDTTSGQIETIRTSSMYHDSIPSSDEPDTIFKLNSAFTDCEWVGVKNSDQVFVSMILSAQAQGKSITVWYYKDEFSPVWSNVCQAITIELK